MSNTIGIRESIRQMLGSLEPNESMTSVALFEASDIAEEEKQISKALYAMRKAGVVEKATSKPPFAYRLAEEAPIASRLPVTKEPQHQKPDSGISVAVHTSPQPTKAAPEKASNSANLKPDIDGMLRQSLTAARDLLSLYLIQMDDEILRKLIANVDRAEQDWNEWREAA